MIGSRIFQKELEHVGHSLEAPEISQMFRHLWSFRYVIYLIYERKDRIWCLSLTDMSWSHLGY